jgi:hypothetical protein
MLSYKSGPERELSINEELQPDWLVRPARMIDRWSVGLIVGLGLGLENKITLAERLVWPWGKIRLALIVGLIAGLILGLPAGLIAGLESAFQHLMRRFWLARTNCLPLHAITFLNDACERALLKRIGGTYRFIHQIVLDYFADQNTDPATANPQRYGRDSS